MEKNSRWPPLLGNFLSTFFIFHFRHLLVKADADEDSFLSKVIIEDYFILIVLYQTEVLDQYDMFVGSSATQFGEVLARHQEF